MTIKNVLELDAAIRAVCSIEGVNSDGLISFSASATEAEKAAAQAVIDAFDDSDALSDWESYQKQAQAELDKSDITVLRCIESDVPIPATWKSYRSTLRSILSATAGDATQPLPLRPAYPEGT